jgi:hypothetical protein
MDSVDFGYHAKLEKVQSLLRRWDPIEVCPGQDAPADEYNRYAPQIVGMLSRGATKAEVMAYLRMVRTELIGLPKNDVRDESFAIELVGLWPKDP